MLVAVVLVVRHMSFWRSLDQLILEPEEIEFFRQQFRRRMQASVLIGIIGLTISFIDWITSPNLFTVFVFTWLLMIAWIVWLALVEMFRSRSFLRNLAVQQRIKRAQLEAEIEKLKQMQRTGEENGHARK